MEDQICSAVYEPVITADGKKFSSPCMAKNAGYTTFSPYIINAMQQKSTMTTGQTPLDHALNVGLIFVGVSTLVLLGILIFKKP
jgi:hypothetical protein